MTDSSLKDRLRDHSEAFDSLLSLIPAKLYYGEDTSNQWQRKKQTKEQARAAKRSKLDPDSALNRNAKEVLDERVRNKRKAQELEPSEDGSVNDEDDDAQELQLRGISKETPGEGLKKRKVIDDEAHEKSNTAQLMAGDEARPQNLSTHQEKKRLKKQKKAEKNAEKEKTKTAKAIGMSGPVKDGHAAPGKKEEPTTPVDVVQSKEPAEGGDTKSQKTMRPIDVSGLVDDDADHTSSQASTPSSPTFDTAEPGSASAEPASTTTSIASENAPADKSRKIKVPSDTTELRARLAAKIAALRAARKADGPDGTPIRTREELIESRRKKLAERKAHKKELRQKAKEAEDKKREEALASARNSPMLGFGSGSPEHESFSFGRVAFADGTQMSHDLSYTKDKNGKKKGPIDPKGALAKVEAQKKRLAGLDDAKRKEVLEKEAWLAARRKAEGEKVHDNESLLKKAVKRKEKAKKKSEKEWSDRVQGVQKAQKQRQQKREENIRKRKETKQAGKGGKKKGGGKPSAKKSRPGFEGSGFGRRK